MRCFIAIDLPNEIKEHISEVQSSLPKSDMKLVEKHNIHLTLVFLGEIDDYHINRCKQILAQLKFKKLNASLGGIGFFPSQNYIRTIWIALEPSEILKHFYSQIHDKLKEEFKIDNRFESHITLARVKFIENKQDFIKKLLSLDIEKKEFEVDSFALKKSTLTRQGPVYEDIARFQMI